MVRNPAAMQETWVRSLGWEESLEKEMATHFDILAWRIPWTEELSGNSSWDHKESDTNIVVYICQFQSPNCPFFPYPLVTISSFSTSVTLFLFGG